MDLVADIKQRLSIEELVGQYVELRKSGRNYKALCPFHSEKSPSFHVSVEKQIAFCFGCQRGGDLFQFFQEVESVNFPEALKQLAEKAGLDITKYQTTSAAPKVSQDEKKQYTEIHDVALTYFSHALWDSEDGKKVLEYVRGRSLTDATIKEWGIGFSPDTGDGFFRYATDQRIERTPLLKSGLVMARDLDAQQVFDRFRMRLMFPIHDVHGRVVGFGGRALKKGMEPKYLNSPETVSYKKSEILFGLHQAKQAIRAAKRVIMVEGYFDVISCHQAGIQESVATSGTALTTEHARILKRLTDNFYLCFDNDGAGWEATKRAFLILQAIEANVRVIRVPEGKDPADALMTSSDAFRAAIEQAQPFFEVYLDKETAESIGPLSPERVATILAESLSYIRAIPNKVLQDIAIRALASKLGVKEVVIYDELKRSAQTFRGGVKHRTAANASDSFVPGATIRQCKPHELLIVAMLNAPEKASSLVSQLVEEDFFGETMILFQRIKEIVTSGQPFTLPLLAEGLDDSLKAKLDYYTLYGEVTYEHLSIEIFEKDVITALDKVVQNRKNVQLEALKRIIQTFQSAGKKSEMLVALEELRQKLQY